MGPIYHHESPSCEQCRQSVSFIFATTHIPMFPIKLVSKSNYRAMCNRSNNWWRGCDSKNIFGVVFASGRIWYHSFRVKLVSYLLIPNTKLPFDVFISYYMLSSKIRPVGISWYLKPISVILFLVPIVTHCPTCGVLIGTLVW